MFNWDNLLAAIIGLLAGSLPKLIEYFRDKERVSSSYEKHLLEVVTKEASDLRQELKLEIIELKKDYNELKKELDELKEENDRLEEENRKLKNRVSELELNLKFMEKV